MFAAEATVSTPAVHSEAITLDSFADLLSDSVILSKLDIGNALIYKVKHALRGDMVLINTAGDNNAAVYM